MRETETTPVSKALWYIETHFAGNLSLDDVADAGGISRFHMSRVFSLVTGQSFAEYVRGRRLSEAARILADGAPEILTVALGAGYGSHEAFTRAFHARFGLTPEAVRALGSYANLKLTEAQRMETIRAGTLEPPRFEFIERLLIAGSGERYTPDTIAGIPAQWQRFGPHIETVPGRLGRTTYGVLRNNTDKDGSIEYVCGVEVAAFEPIPSDWSRVQIARQHYAVFFHREHVSAIHATCTRIWNEWLPASAYAPADAPEFERYDASFDPRTGFGGVQIWIPIVRHPTESN